MGRTLPFNIALPLSLLAFSLSVNEQSRRSLRSAIWLLDSIAQTGRPRILVHPLNRCPPNLLCQGYREWGAYAAALALGNLVGGEENHPFAASLAGLPNV